MKTVQQYIEEQEYIQEANRIIQGISGATGKPKDYIKGIWKDTEKEILSTHKFGASDMYREIGNIVKAKMGIKKPDEPENKPKAERDQ